MKRLLIAIVMAVVVTGLSVGVAAAWSFDISDTSGGAGTQFDVTFVSDGTETVTTDGFTLIMCYDNPVACTYVAGQESPYGTPFSADDGYASGRVALYLLMPSGTLVLTDGMQLATYTATGDSTHMTWVPCYEDESFLMNDSPDGDTPELVTYDGFELYGAYHLTEDGSPVALFPELGTVILLTLGLLGLGGYVYRRHRAVTVAA